MISHLFSIELLLMMEYSTLNRSGLSLIFGSLYFHDVIQYGVYVSLLTQREVNQVTVPKGDSSRVVT